PISITGGNQTMTITTAVAGAQPTAVINTAVQLRIRRQAAVSKVTAQTSCPGQSFNLAVVVTSSPIGTIAPSVDLTDGMLAADILTSIPSTGPASPKTVLLRYTASATFAQGNTTEMGSDVHTITYTIIAQ
ncbi:MAG: hypothetical protein AABY75_03465, partial [Bacteroidota bacterium]